jgi:hypothetical protein
MMKGLLLLFFFTFTVSLHAQKDTLSVTGSLPQKNYARDASNSLVSIFPVPIRENRFTIKTEKDISFLKVTNIIGQDIFRAQYNNPQQLIKILLENPKRGMYLVTIIFSDGTRVVKKILVEETD